ncbi:MAG: GTP cyclohydrolase I, partial [Eubacterium sp.]|nr:GTP cyclohydrolase I [Eubacterium sp.]
MCMSARGIKKPGSKTISMSTKGVFEEDDKLKDEVIMLMRSEGK